LKEEEVYAGIDEDTGEPTAGMVVVYRLVIASH